MKKIITLLVVLSGLTANAQNLASDLKKIANIDKQKTCNTPVKKQMAQKALSWFTAYKAEDLKSQLSVFSEDFMLFHSALAALAMQVEGNPNVHLPFGVGPLTRKNYVKTLALIAFTEDVRAPLDVPVQLSCLGQDTVVVTVSYSGIKVKRDPEGYITYKSSYGAQAMKMFVFDPKSLLVKRHYVDFDPAVSAAAKADLQKQIDAGVKALDREEASRRTLAEITKQYLESAGIN